MTIKVRIMFSRQTEHGETPATMIEGLEVPFEALTLGDLTDRIAETEAHLSRILGLTVKIETGAE